jgi:hypothetical protein
MGEIIRVDFENRNVLGKGEDEPVVINTEGQRIFDEMIEKASVKVQEMGKFFKTNVFLADSDSIIAQARRDLLIAMSDRDVLEMIINSDESKWIEKPNLYIDLIERFNHIIQ